LTGKALHAKPFADAIPTVGGTPLAFFMCHAALLRDTLLLHRQGCALLFSVNAGNLQRRQGLAMPLLTAIAFTPPMLKDNDFLAPLLRHNLGFDPYSSHDRGSNRDLRSLPDELHMG